jgi:hypothetical protein
MAVERQKNGIRFFTPSAPIIGESVVTCSVLWHTLHRNPLIF